MFRSLSSHLLFLLLACALAAPAARAASIIFSATIDGAPREITLEQYLAEGVSYISVSSLATQTGGAMRVTSTQLEMDLSGASAIVPINGREVTGSQQVFSLAHPVLPFETDVLMAEADVATFLNGAFGVPAAQRASDGTLQGVASVDIMPEEEEEDLLESIAVPAPPSGTPSTLNPIQKIIIDPGHGGEDLGVVGASGTPEKVIALAIAQHLGRVLTERGISVYLTRDADKPLSDAERVNIANQQDGDLFLSIHVAASPVARTNGFEIFAPSRNSSTQAKPRTIGFMPHTGNEYTPMNNYIGEILLESIHNATGAQPRGIRAAPLRALGAVPMPALLVEAGFVTNEAEEQLLVSEAHQAKIAQGIATGLQQVIEAYENRL